MLMRDRELRWTVAVSAAVVLAGSCVFLALGDAWGAVAILLCGGIVMGAFLALTLRRQRALARMAERVDEALHAGRTVSLADMNEGELAILASEVDKALTRLTLTAEELAREKASLADSLADISHQLRTPLTSLGLTLALARKELVAKQAASFEAACCEGSPALAEALEHLRTSERLLTQVQWLVEALLKLARIDAGAVHLQSAPVDVVALVDEAAEPLTIHLELAGVRLEKASQSGTSFTGDAAWTREALENVLKNCLEHTPEGGVVRVETSEDALACRITVTDTGPGIAEADLPHVFERFYRGGASDPSDVSPGGVGIGLSLAQSLITAQDGRITAGNVIDANGNITGARFDITFFKAVV